MGAWGTGSFENDDALDFLVRLEGGSAAIAEALEDVTALDAQDYLEAPEASSAIAAAEIVAAAHDGDASQLSETVQAWLEAHRDSVSTPSLLALAHRAVERVLARSELKDLWEEGIADAQSEAWASGVRQLIGRLEAKPQQARKGQAPKGPRTRQEALGPGTILRVDLDDQWHTYARILARVPMVAFYDCRVDAPIENLQAIIKHPVLFVLAVGVRAHKGLWPKIGHVPLEAAPIPIPPQFMQDIGTGQCQIVDEAFNARPVTPEECVGLERVAVWDATHVTERLRNHYAGRQNAHLEYMKVKLPRRP